jgi:plasmid stability protein
MATLTIRNVDPVLEECLRLRAARNGRSVEAELRCILSRRTSRKQKALKGKGVSGRWS